MFGCAAAVANCFSGAGKLRPLYAIFNKCVELIHNCIDCTDSAGIRSASGNALGCRKIAGNTTAN